MNEYIPYTYYLYHPITGKKYYGVRYKKNCTPEDLWNKYFSSSKIIKEMIKVYGINSFLYEVRRTFKTAKEARDWECKVLWKMKVVEKSDWINQNYGKSNPSMAGKKHKDSTLQLMSLKQKGSNNPMWGKTHTPEVRQKISIGNLGKIISAETKEKIGSKARGRKISIEKRHYPTQEETEKRSKTNRERGHKRSVEQKKRMQEAAKGRKWKKCPDTGRRIFYRIDL